MKKLLLAALLSHAALPAAAAEPVLKMYLGAGGYWADATPDKPADMEVGGTARASLSPHIDMVGGVWYGVEHSYLRGTFGVRVTVTDVNDPNFSIGVGFLRHASSEPDLRSEAWAPEVALGWRALPETMPRVIFAATAGKLLDHDESYLTVGFRYFLTDFKGGSQ